MFPDSISATVIAIACSDLETWQNRVSNAGGQVFDVQLTLPDGTKHANNQYDPSFAGNSSEISFLAVATALQNISSSWPDPTTPYLLPSFYDGGSAPLGPGWCDPQIWNERNHTTNVYNATSHAPVIAVFTDQTAVALAPAKWNYNNSVAQYDITKLPDDWRQSTVWYWNLSKALASPQLETLTVNDWLHRCASLIFMSEAVASEALN